MKKVFMSFRFENESLKDSQRNVKRMSELWFSHFVEEEKDRLMMNMMGRFKRLTYEDLEEVYMDGCMVLWRKLNEEGFELRKESTVSYLNRICWNIGNHYLRDVRNDIVSTDEMMEERYGDEGDKEYCSIDEMFEIVDEVNREEDGILLRKLDEVWKKLSDVDKVILTSYYWDEMSMKDIVKRIGYKTVDSVKNKKSKCLKKMLKLMKEKAADKQPSPFSYPNTSSGKILSELFFRAFAIVRKLLHLILLSSSSCTFY